MKKEFFERFYSAVHDGQDAKTVADTMSAAAKTAAIRTLFDENGNFLYLDFIKGREYLSIDADAKGVDDVKECVVRATDVFCIKKGKNSVKHELPAVLYTMLECFGGNLCDEYVATRKGCIATMKVYGKYTPSAECFLSDTEKGRNASSVGQLEKQLNAIIAEMTGDGVITARKSTLRHLSDTFIRATKESAKRKSGYACGNAIALLECVRTHAKDALNGHYEYVIKSGLANHKDPEKKNK